MADPTKTFELNANKLRKHFREFCEGMGMDYTQWNEDIHMTPQVMMEGTSPESLTAIFSYKHGGHKFVFSLGRYNRKYEIREVTPR